MNTLNDWAKFDINKRTKFDAAISSGLAVMACNKNRYRPRAESNKRIQKLTVNFSSYTKYNNNGNYIKNNIINMAESVITKRYLPEPSS